MRVAVAGTGRMGSAMARALARGGAEVDALQPHAGTGTSAGRRARRGRGWHAAEAAASADVAITMLVDGDAVRATWDGPEGLVAGAHPGGVLVDSSTVPPDTLGRVRGRRP